MPDIKPSGYITAILVFTLLLVGSVSMIGLMRVEDSNYFNGTEYKTFNSTFNKIDDATSNINSIKSNIENNENTNYGIFGVLNSLIMNSWQVLKTIFTSFGFMESVFTGLSTMFGIPAWVTGIMILLVTVLFAFAIYSAIFQREL